jgi:hypothetical protein
LTYASTRDELVARLVRAGELEISGENQQEVDSYFDTENFAFHGPDGFDSDYAGLTEYFQSIRAAFEDRTIRRESSSPRAISSPVRPGSRAPSPARSPTHPRGSSSRTEHGSSGTS